MQQMVTAKSSSDEWYKFKTTLEFIKDSVDLRDLLEALGFKITKETNKELRAPCFVHGGDNETSFRLNKETRTWVCFSHKCHEMYHSDLIGLIRACKNLTFMEAVSFLKDFIGYTDEGDSEKANEYKHLKEKRDFVREYSEETRIVKSKFVREDVLKHYKQYRSNFFNLQGFTNETLDFFEIAGGYVDDKGMLRDIIPIRDIDGFVVGCSFSATQRGVSYADKYISTGNLDKDNVLYNLNNAVEHIKDKPLIVVEGFKSVWRFHQIGIYNAVCVMGSVVTPGQQSLIYTYAPKGIVIMFDNDIPGICGAVSSEEILSKKTHVEVVFIKEIEKGVGLDPADLTDEAILNYLKEYI